MVNRMNLTRLPFLIFVPVILLLCLNPASAQIQNRKIFDAIPVSQRDRFIARLNLYIDYLLKNDQTKLETLYDEDTLCGLCKGKRECIDDCRPPMTADVPEAYLETTVAFTPRDVKPDRRNNQTYSVEVEERDRVSWKGKPPWTRKTTVHVYAVFERGDWYFSLVSIPGTVLM
jgi:hypothetical protein